MEQVVFIGAHPDDFTGCCGTALLMRGKFGLNIWDFTRGEHGLANQGVSLETCGAMREAEERKVAAYMNASLYFCDEVNGDAYACRETCGKLAERLKALNPRAIFTHSVADSHGEHMMTAVAVLKAIQLSGIHPEIYTFEFSHQSRGFMPRFFVDISAVQDEKDKVIRFYECQNMNDSIVRNKRQIGAFRGMQCRAAYAEAFGTYDFMHSGERVIFSDL